MTTDELDRIERDLLYGALHPDKARTLTAEVRRLRALVREAYEAGHEKGFYGEPVDEAWQASTARAKLDGAP